MLFGHLIHAPPQKIKILIKMFVPEHRFPQHLITEFTLRFHHLLEHIIVAGAVEQELVGVQFE